MVEFPFKPSPLEGEGWVRVLSTSRTPPHPPSPPFRGRGRRMVEFPFKPSPLEGEGWVRGLTHWGTAMNRVPPVAVRRARELRRNQTDVERKLWLALRGRRFS